MRILLIEDEPKIASFVIEGLQAAGMRIEHINNGPEGLQTVLQAQHDLVVLDIMLPGMDGYEVARTLRDRPEFKHVTICALTGYTPSDADRQRQAATGFDHHFVKPIRLEVLIDLFKSVAKQPLLRDENCDE